MRNQPDIGTQKSTLTKKLIILAFISTLISCGPRSGVSNEKEEPAVCGVTDESNKIGSPQNESQVNGKKIFDSQCESCHSVDQDVKCGNMMRGVHDRIPKSDWFKRFVLNSDSLKKSGDGYANKINDDWNTDFEHNFKKLSDKDIEDIYNYLRLW